MLRELSAKCRVSAEEIGTCMNTDSTLKAGHLHLRWSVIPKKFFTIACYIAHALSLRAYFDRFLVVFEKAHSILDSHCDFSVSAVYNVFHLCSSACLNF